MAPAVLAIVAATILVTSFISGIFGMAGGIILLGVLLIFLDVAPAMMLSWTAAALPSLSLPRNKCGRSQ